MKQLDRRFLNQRSYASTRVDFNQVGARSIVTRGLLVCDGAHVSTARRAKARDANGRVAVRRARVRVARLGECGRFV